MKGPARTPLSPRIRTFIMERGPVVRRWILMGLAAGVPIFFLRTGSDPFNVPKLALLVGGLSVVVALRVIELTQGASARGLERLLVPAAFMAIPISVSWLFADFRYWSLFGLFARFQGLIPYLLVILFGVLVADAFRGEARSLAWSLLIAAAVVGGYAIVQFLGLDPFNWQFGTLTTRAEQTLSTLGNSNFTGGFLGIAMPVAVAVWIADPAERSRLKKMVPLIVVGWLLTRSEGGWAAGIAGTAIVLGFFLRKRWKLAPLLGGAVAAGMALLVTGAVLITLVQPSLRLPFTAEERGHWWVAAARMGAGSPFVGHGPNSFAVIGVQYRIREEALEQGFNYTDDPHSVPLSLFSGSGALGLLGYLALVGWVFYRSVGIDPNDFLSMGFLGGSFAYLVQSLVSIDELSLRVGFWLCLAGLALGPLSSWNRRATPNPARGKRSSSRSKRARSLQPLRHAWLVPLLTAACILPVVWSALFIRSDNTFHLGQMLFQRGVPAAGKAKIIEARSFREEYRYRHLLGFYLGKAAIERGREGEGLIEDMSVAFSYLQNFPDALALRDRGRLLHEWRPDDPETNSIALNSYLRALEFDPFNPFLRVEAAQVALSAERFATLEMIVRPTDESLRDRFPSLWAGAAEVEAAAGDPHKALELYGRALEQENSNSDFWVGAAKVGVEAGMYREVIDLVEPVVRSLDTADLWGVFALAHAEVGNRLEARDAIDRALELDPQQSDALHARAVLASADRLVP